MTAAGRWRRRLLGAIAALVALFALSWLAGALRWRAGVERLQTAMWRAGSAPARPAVVDDDLQALPPCVRRCLGAVLPASPVRIVEVRLRQRGTLHLAESDQSWASFTAAQAVVLQRPGFVWDAVVEAAGLPVVRVVDAYVGGEGHSEAALLGLLPFGEQHGGGELATAQLQRFLAEAAWYPTALLPGPSLRWQELDEHRASATLRDGDAEATLTFTFDEHDRIASVRAEARGRRVGDALVPTPWRGRFWDYAERDGVQVPLQAEVIWELPDGDLPAWRGQIEHIGYQWAR